MTCTWTWRPGGLGQAVRQLGIGLATLDEVQLLIVGDRRIQRGGELLVELLHGRHGGRFAAAEAEAFALLVTLAAGLSPLSSLHALRPRAATTASPAIATRPVVRSFNCSSFAFEVGVVPSR